MQEIINIVVPLLIGSIMIIAGFSLIEKKNRIIENGVEAEGIIFGFESSIINNISTSYPVLRFVTKEGAWITEVSDYSPPRFLLKEGQKVKVVYDAGNPKNFIFKTSPDISRMNYLFIVIGCVCLLVGLWFAFRFLTT